MMIISRSFLKLALVCCLATPAAATEAEAWRSLENGAIVLFRHANAPGGGDPPGMRIGNCATQRNLDRSGREQALRIGEAFRVRAISVSEVLSSQWCRALETARIAFGPAVREEPVFNSFFDDESKGPAQSRAALAILSRYVEKGALVIVTHQVNITSITGISPASGEGVVVRINKDRVKVVGRIKL
jgi:phosphohistidine phosphatase SixA